MRFMSSCHQPSVSWEGIRQVFSWASQIHLISTSHQWVSEHDTGSKLCYKFDSNNQSSSRRILSSSFFGEFSPFNNVHLGWGRIYLWTKYKLWQPNIHQGTLQAYFFDCTQVFLQFLLMTTHTLSSHWKYQFCRLWQVTHSTGYSEIFGKVWGHLITQNEGGVWNVCKQILFTKTTWDWPL